MLTHCSQFQYPRQLLQPPDWMPLTHCLEAYTNKFSQPFIDMYAYKGMQLIAAHIVTTVQNGSNIKARENVAMGSLLGGFCLGR